MCCKCSHFAEISAICVLLLVHQLFEFSDLVLFRFVESKVLCCTVMMDSKNKNSKNFAYFRSL